MWPIGRGGRQRTFVAARQRLALPKMALGIVLVQSEFTRQSRPHDNKTSVSSNFQFSIPGIGQNRCRYRRRRGDGDSVILTVAYFLFFRNL